MTLKKSSQIISFYLLPIAIAVVVTISPELPLFRKMGTIAFWMLSFNLFVKPLSVLFRVRFLQLAMTIRREVGIGTFWMYVGHSLGMIYTFGLTPGLMYSDPTSFLFYGSIAGIGMYLLAMTSNDFAVRLMKRNWKRLHRVAYLVFFFSLYHSSVVEDNLAKFYVMGSLYILLKILEFRKIPFVW